MKLTIGNEYVMKNGDEPIVVEVLDTQPDSYGCIRVQWLRWADSERQQGDRIRTEECWCYPSDLSELKGATV